MLAPFVLALALVAPAAAPKKPAARPTVSKTARAKPAKAKLTKAKPGTAKAAKAKPAAAPRAPAAEMPAPDDTPAPDDAPDEASQDAATSGPAAIAAPAAVPMPAAVPALPPPPPAAPQAQPAPTPRALPPAPRPRAPGKQRVAVMEIKSVQGVSAGSVEILGSVIAADIARFGFDVIATSDIAAMLGFERQKQLLGCTENASCIAEIAGSLGAEFVVSGQVGQLGSQYNVSLLVVDARKAKVVTRLSSFSDKNEDALLKAVRSGVATIVAAMKGDLPPPPVAAAAPRRPWTRSRTTAWVSWSASAAMLAGGVAAGLAAKSRYDDLAARRAEAGYDRIYADEERGIRTMNLAADALFVGAAGAAALGTWVWFRADREVAVVPTVAPGGAGLALAGSF